MLPFFFVHGVFLSEEGLLVAASCFGPRTFHSVSDKAQIRNEDALRPMGRTRVFWNAARRHSPPSWRVATRVWIEARSCRAAPSRRARASGQRRGSGSARL